MAVFKRETYLNISQRFLTFKMCGDWLFYIEIAKQGDVFISGRVLNYFRKHKKDVSGKIYGTGFNYVEEVEILKILKNEKLITQQEFKHHLLSKYIWFKTFKHEFKDDINAEIRKSLYHNDGDVSYKWFFFTGNYTLLKIKIRRRLNLLFK